MLTGAETYFAAPLNSFKSRPKLAHRGDRGQGRPLALPHRRRALAVVIILSLDPPRVPS